MENAAEFIKGLIVTYPIVATIVFVIGGLRVVFKPIFSVLHAFVEYTPNPKDNEKLAAIEATKTFKAISWFFDFVASIKLVK